MSLLSGKSLLLLHHTIHSSWPSTNHYEAPIVDSKLPGLFIRFEMDLNLIGKNQINFKM
jgi:hypothetical protein